MNSSSCVRCSWHLIPICLAVTSVIGIITTYCMAKRNCHIEKWILPYISYTGTEHPESSLFGLILNIEGFLGVLIVVLAWRFVRHLKVHNGLNRATLITGLFGCSGVIIVANFQVSKNKIPHYIGAGLALIVGTVYCTLSSILNYEIHKKRAFSSTIICALRFSAASIMVLSIITLIVFHFCRKEYKRLYMTKNVNSSLSQPLPLRYPNGSCVPIINTVPVGKRYLDLVMSISEWLLTICLLFSLSLYAYEFKHFDNVKIVLKQRGYPLTPLHSRSDCSSSIRHQTSQKGLLPSNTGSCSSHCEKTYISTEEDSLSDPAQKIFITNEIAKIKSKNNNTDLVWSPKFVDSDGISKSLPNISKYSCDMK